MSFKSDIKVWIGLHRSKNDGLYRWLDQLNTVRIDEKCNYETLLIVVVLVAGGSSSNSSCSNSSCSSSCCDNSSRNSCSSWTWIRQENGVLNQSNIHPIVRKVTKSYFYARHVTFLRWDE